ncbi:class I SAM-dependent methyltransferase [Methylorubrum podarium]|jgi:Methyltransferase domain|uniref:class I SAM-dependent methyltransferase n=1 Tax=Methylorubrum podarium TaxID=200476 RepID=UPI001EE34FFE|nr:class I SAM-dependent methyltransferase [Methylorubrum podarium]
MAHPILEKLLFPTSGHGHWHMTFGERAGLLHVLRMANSEVSIEIGTFLGGSLAPISHYSQIVYTFDIDANQHRDTKRHDNVNYITGDSNSTLPAVISRLNKSAQEINFILIDGSHEADGVRADIDNCLQYIPKTNPTYILMHDSSNPTVRRGIAAAGWEDCAYVHAVDFDYVPGLMHDRADIRNEIWGGLALAVLLPEKRAGELTFARSYDYSLSKMNQLC